MAPRDKGQNGPGRRPWVNQPSVEGRVHHMFSRILNLRIFFKKFGKSFLLRSKIEIKMLIKPIIITEKFLDSLIQDSWKTCDELVRFRRRFRRFRRRFRRFSLLLVVLLILLSWLYRWLFFAYCHEKICILVKDHPVSRNFQFLWVLPTYRMDK